MCGVLGEDDIVENNGENESIIVKLFRGIYGIQPIESIKDIDGI